MFVRTKLRPNGKISVQIVESYRRADKVSQRILRHVGQGVNEKEIDKLIVLANFIIEEMKEERQRTLPLFAPEALPSTAVGEEKEIEDKVSIGNLREEQRVIDGIGDVFGKLYDDLSFGCLLTGTRNNSTWNEALKTCVLARLTNPTSKLRTAAMLERDFGIRLPVEKIYRMMDHVARREEAIRACIGETTKTLLQQKVDVMFFDVTTLYFESFEEDELRKFGFSKDCKFKETQVVLALVTTTDGLPLDYLLFPGDTYEGHTLLNAVEELQKKYEIREVRLLADRAMFNEDNLELMEQKGIRYVVAAKLRNLPKSLCSELLADEGYRAAVVGHELHWIKEIEYKGRRLLVSYNQARARKDSSDRQRLIERLMKKQRKNGKMHVKDLVGNRGTAKYLKVTEEDIVMDVEKIAKDSAWDGLHGVISNTVGDSAEIIASYGGLWQIEAAFRVQKHDLRMRPIFHWTPSRIKAHISICYIAYTLIKQALHRLKILGLPISFEKMQNELLHAQSSIVVDVATKKHYRIPSNATIEQKKIYQAFGLRRSAKPQPFS